MHTHAVVRKIDNLLLLLGGQIMYDGHMGTPLQAKFQELGFPKPDDYNIAGKSALVLFICMSLCVQ